MSVVRLKRKGKGATTRGEVQFDSSWPHSQMWCRHYKSRLGMPVVFRDGYLRIDFSEGKEALLQEARIHAHARHRAGIKILSRIGPNVFACARREIMAFTSLSPSHFLRTSSRYRWDYWSATLTSGDFMSRQWMATCRCRCLPRSCRG